MLSNEISLFDKINVMKPIGNAKVWAVGDKVCFSKVHQQFCLSNWKQAL